MNTVARAELVSSTPVPTKLLQTSATTSGLICACCGFQAEHPLVLQIKQRRSLKPRFLIWGGLYAGVAITIACYLYWQGDALSPLLWIYAGAIAAFLIDAISVFHREQKSMLNELITFFAVCLSAPLAYVVTTGVVIISHPGTVAFE
jgi:putative flippase GtrA